MPIYEYKCLKCKDLFEAIQKINDAPLSVCRECGGELKKQITNTSFVLKGSGWYVTDHPSDARKKAMDKKAARKKSKEPDTKGSSKKKEVSKVK